MTLAELRRGGHCECARLMTFGRVRDFVRAVSVPLHDGIICTEECHTVGFIAQDRGDVWAFATLWIWLERHHRQIGKTPKTRQRDPFEQRSRLCTGGLGVRRTQRRLRPGMGCSELNHFALPRRQISLPNPSLGVAHVPY